MTTPRTKSRQSGVTLVELMISLVIVSIAVAATFALGFSLMNGYSEHRRMMEVERSARVSMEIVADAIRLASAGVPNGDVQDLVGCSLFGGIRITNNTNAPDEIEAIHASGGVLTALTNTYDATSTEIFVFDASELAENDYVLITDGTIGHFVQIGLPVDLGADRWQLPLVAGGCTPAPAWPVAGNYPLSTLVVRARSTHFFIETSTDTGMIPTLMMDPDGLSGDAEPEPVAQGIEDMQIVVGVDDSPADGLISDIGVAANDDEWHYNVAGDGDPPVLTATPWRALRLTLIGRSINEVSTQAMSTRPAAEDRPAASTADEFRRRVLSSTIEIRNLEGSPP
jgi:prepilin-type N-terminal cleavage/methylation domain-containing protein